ncbi:flavoprotein-domain-containing protein [Scleroderma citrinum]
MQEMCEQLVAEYGRMIMSGWSHSALYHLLCSVVFCQDSYQVGDPILRTELRRWAGVVLVAPCSANTLAKVAGGLCDNLVICILVFSHYTNLGLCSGNGLWVYLHLRRRRAYSLP